MLVGLVVVGPLLAARVLALCLIVPALAMIYLRSTPAAADPCLTRAEARHKFGDVHLYWHTEAHCWDNVPVGKATRTRYAPPPIHHEVVDRAGVDLPPAEIAYPTVRVSQDLPTARWPGWAYVPWFTPWSMTGWPLVYDFDEPEKFAPWTKRIE